MAASAGLDLLGIVAIALVSAMGGGIMRDLLVGEVPPEALRGWPLLTVALTGALLTILFVHQVAAIPEGPLLVIDALGLSLLAVAAAEKSLEYETGADCGDHDGGDRRLRRRGGARCAAAPGARRAAHSISWPPPRSLAPPCW